MVEEEIHEKRNKKKEDENNVYIKLYKVKLVIKEFKSFVPSHIP